MSASPWKVQALDRVRELPSRPNCSSCLASPASSSLVSHRGENFACDYIVSPCFFVVLYRRLLEIERHLPYSSSPRAFLPIVQKASYHSSSAARLTTGTCTPRGGSTNATLTKGNRGATSAVRVGLILSQNRGGDGSKVLETTSESGLGWFSLALVCDWV